MPYQTATATNHHDALDQLNDFVTSEGGVIGALSAVIGAGGSGYAIGDDLTLVGGSFKSAATFNVDSEGATAAAIAAGGSGYTDGAQTLTLVGGTFTTAATVDVLVVSNAVDSIVGINIPGDYTVTPGDPVATTGGGGTGATLNMTFGAVATVSLLAHGVYSEIDGGGQPSSPAGTTVAPAGGTGATLTVTYSPDIVAIGSSYVVGDIIVVSGGTSTSITTLKVTSVDGGGGVTGIKYEEHGGYTVEPTNTVSTTGGTGTGLTLDLNYDTNGWTLQRNNVEAASAVIGVGGTGYVIGDDITLVGGVEVKVAGVFNVDSEGAVSSVRVSGGTGYPNGAQTFTLAGGTFTTAATIDCNVTGGVIDAAGITINNPGAYTVTPGNPVTVSGGNNDATMTVTFGAVALVSVVTSGDYGEVPAAPAATSGGTGSGATLTVTFQRVTGSKGRDLILLGDLAGAATIGFRSYTDGGSGADSWELRGMTSYSAANDWESQPDICDGDNTVFENGQYVPLDNGTLTYSFYVEGASIRAIFAISTTRTNAYSGFLDRFGTETEYPYPMLVMGCSSSPQRLFGSTVIGYRGMCDPVSAAVGHLGPGRVRTPGGVWNVVKNSEDTGTGRSVSQDTVIWPAGTPDPTDALLQDRGSTTLFEFTDVIPTTGNPGSPTLNLIQTEDSPEDASIMMVPIVAESFPIVQLLGAMRGVRWVSAKADPSDLVSGDTLIDGGGNTWDVFQNCNQTDQWTFFCVRREQ